MIKKRIVLLSVLLVAFLTTSITALAATCGACEVSHVYAECIQHGQHLWHHASDHINVILRVVS